MRNTIILFFILSGLSAFCQSYFIENKGQLHDLNNQPVPCVKYIYSQGMMNVQLREDGFSYDVFESCGSNNELANTEDFLNNEINTDGPYQRIHRVDVDFYHCNKSIELTAEQQQYAVMNYYTTGTGGEGLRDVHSYRKITYQEVYDGIDVEFEIHPDVGFEYSFIVKDAGDVNDIQLRYRGQEDMWLDGNELYLQLSMEVLKESIPKSYYTKDGKFVEVQYKLSNDVVSFDTGNDVATAMIIDPIPELIYASLFGGEGQDYTRFMETQIDGGYIIVGSTRSANVIATTGSYQQAIGSLNNSDCYLQRWSSTDQLQWSTYFGGENFDFVFGSHFDDAEGVFICGVTQSTTQIASANAFQLDLQELQDGFIARFDISGHRLWSTYFGGNGLDAMGDMVVVDNRIIACGNTHSTDMPINGTPIQNQLNGNSDALLTQWTLEGALTWSSYFGGEGSDGLFHAQVDLENRIYFVGGTDSETGIELNGIQTQFGGGANDAWIVQLSAQLEPQLSTYFGGANDEDVEGIVKTNNNDVLIFGRTTSSEGIASVGTYDQSLNGSTDAFVLRLFSNGSDFQCTYFGGSNRDELHDVTELSDGSIVIVGYTESTSGIATSNAWQPFYHPPQLTGFDMGDGFIAKLNGDLTDFLWGTYVGNFLGDNVQTVSQVGEQLLVSGYSISTADLPAEYQGTFITPDAYQTTFGGDSDAFIARFGNVLGVEEKGNDLSINVYPNPTKEKAHLELPHSDNWLVNLYDSKGQLQRMETIKAITQLEINAKDLLDGIYLLTAMDTSGNVYVSKVEVQK